MNENSKISNENFFITSNTTEIEVESKYNQYNANISYENKEQKNTDKRDIQGLKLIKIFSILGISFGLATGIYIVLNILGTFKIIGKMPLYIDLPLSNFLFISLVFAIIAFILASKRKRQYNKNSELYTKKSAEKIWRIKKLSLTAFIIVIIVFVFNIISKSLEISECSNLFNIETPIDNWDKGY